MYLSKDNSYFPSNTTEVRGRFVGIGENFGHDMTFKFLNTSTKKIISRYAVRPTDDDKLINLRAGLLTSLEVIKSVHDDSITST